MIPQTATSGIMAKFGDFLRVHPENIFPNEDNIADKVPKMHIAYSTVI